MCHMSQKKIFKKSQHFEFFQKWGVKGIKKQKFWKNTSKIEKGFKNWVLNMCHMPQNEKKILKQTLWQSTEDGILKFRYRLFWFQFCFGIFAKTLFCFLFCLGIEKISQFWFWYCFGTSSFGCTLVVSDQYTKLNRKH